MGTNGSGQAVVLTAQKLNLLNAGASSCLNTVTRRPDFLWYSVNPGEPDSGFRSKPVKRAKTDPVSSGFLNRSSFPFSSTNSLNRSFGSGALAGNENMNR